MTSMRPTSMTTASTTTASTTTASTATASTATTGAAPRLVVPFAAGDGSQADLLGGKGAGLAQMTRLGLPVPAGFTVTTHACREFLATGHVPSGLWEEVREAVAGVERVSGLQLGDPTAPLLVSVRSGARFSMPGMMETVLDVGVTDEVVEGLARRWGGRFAWDCYRRLVQMYGRTVLGVDAGAFEVRLAQAREQAGAATDQELGAPELQAVTASFRALVRERAGQDVPQDPWEQLRRSVLGVFESWTGERARRYRAHEGIAEDLGTAVSVVQMVFGNRGRRSGSGVCFTRDPASGAPGAYGDYLADAQGEDVVNGSRTPVSLADLASAEPALHAELLGHLQTLERHYRDMCDVEFTVEEGRLWVLQTRVGKRSPGAAFRIAADLVDEAVIGWDDALVRVTGQQLASVLSPRFATGPGDEPLGRGLAASPGAASGVACFDAATAMERAAAGEAVVLVRPETSPDDLGGMLAAVALVTARGGLTSHAAVVARGLGRVCVSGVSGLVVDEAGRSASLPGGVVVREGDLLSVDGSSGEVFLGRREVVASAAGAGVLVGDAAEAADAEAAGSAGDSAGADPVGVAVRRLLAHADARRRLGVRVNAETVQEARAARAAGAQGVGLCRTEHMLLGERRELVERVVTGVGRDQALAEIERLAGEELEALLEVMDGLPVVVRLLDPPLHEFLPDLTQLAQDVAGAQAGGADATDLAALTGRLEVVRRWHETNPMLGLRGVRLLLVVPEVVEVHVRALAAATLRLRRRGLDPRPEVMVPLVSDVAELDAAVERVERAVASVAAEHGAELTLPVGVMVELPRAALTSGALARRAAFFSYGTNDLTQTTWGMSRDDAETSFLAEYRRAGVLAADPFQVLDREGVGRLVRLSAAEGRAANPGLTLGACGEHAGEPSSIHVLADAGVDYVSCSAPRVPVARLEAGRYAVLTSVPGQRTSDTR